MVASSEVQSTVSTVDLGALPDGSAVTIKTNSTRHVIVLRNNKRIMTHETHGDIVVGIMYVHTDSETLTRAASRLMGMTRQLRVGGEFSVVYTHGRASTYNSSTIKELIVHP